MKHLHLKKSFFSSPIAFVCNLLMVYIVYGLCRLAYLFENWSVLSEGFDKLSWMDAFKGCWMFDTSAILYTNALYAILMLIPLHWKEKNWWQQMTKWIFVAVNSLCIIANLADAVYFQYTGRRTTSSVFQEFSNEGNIGDVVGVELLRHWYLVLVGIVLIVGLIVLYVRPRSTFKVRMLKDILLYYTIHTVCFGLYIPITIAGMRGGATTAVRPITISNANQYVNRASEAALILNTPFSMIRTLNKNVFVDPKFFSHEELDTIYSPIHEPADSAVMMKKNVVVLIMESYGREYIGGYNPLPVLNPQSSTLNSKPSLTPFTDSLIKRSLTFDLTIANGRKSIDGMPSILSSIPRFIEPFFLTPASMNEVSGLAGELGKVGYESAFFHGAENGSMGFEAFAKKTGYDAYFGRTEYNQDKRFNGDKDFDGMWAIWDEEFLQFYARTMSEMSEPFMTAVFTASSHHPFKVPERYEGVFPQGSQPLHQCIGYSDYAIRRFFEYARTQPWYENTLFVITADHTNQLCTPAYTNALGKYRVPIAFFCPAHLPAEQRTDIISQTDIMPSVLGFTGYPKPYFAFGEDALTTHKQHNYAVCYYNPLFQIMSDSLLMQFDGKEVTALYAYRTDTLLVHPLPVEQTPVEMTNYLKAYIQQYIHRMITNQLTHE